MLVATLPTQAKPTALVTAKSVTAEGTPRTFPGPGGSTVSWSPSSPVYRGDRLELTFAMSENTPIREVIVDLNGKRLARIGKAPWQLTIQAEELTPGKHLVCADIRTQTTPIMYGLANLEFYVRNQPMEMVKGTRELLVGAGPTNVKPTLPVKTDSSVTARLRSTDLKVDADLATGKHIQVNSPVKLRVESNAARWAYSILRGDTEVASGGPMSRTLDLELAPKTEGEPGLLPGRLTLKVWAVRDDNVRSEPVVVPIVVSQEGQK